MSRCLIIRNRLISCRLVVLAAFIVLAAALQPHAAQASDFQSCNSCHQAALTAENSRKHVHSPFKKGQCDVCHAVQASEDAAAAKADPLKINWLAESYIQEVDQGFLLPADQVGKTLVVELIGPFGVFSIHEIAVPPRAGLAAAQDSGKPPAIADLRVLKVQRGLLLSATIGWHTDSLTFAQVRYGDKDLDQLSAPGNWLARDHKVVLYGLQPDTTYHFTAISQDIFGHRQVSAPMTFSTLAPSADALRDKPAALPQVGQEGGILNCSFQRFGADYLVELKLKQPASVNIGCRCGDTRCQPDDAPHQGLSCGVKSETEACLTCHSAHLELVNQAPTYQEMGLPREYPTLADGRVTCISCHEPHGSDYAYYKRRPSKNKLCANCHLWGFLDSARNAGQKNPHTLKVSEIPTGK